MLTETLVDYTNNRIREILGKRGEVTINEHDLKVRVKPQLTQVTFPITKSKGVIEMDTMVAAGYIITILLICFNTYLVLTRDVEIDQEHQPNKDLEG